MSERLLTIEQIAEILPLSDRQLYRVARRGGGPFRKIEGRWMAYEDELHDWIRSHKPRSRPEAVDAMPLPRRRDSSFRQKVIDLQARRAS